MIARSRHLAWRPFPFLISLLPIPCLDFPFSSKFSVEPKLRWWLFLFRRGVLLSTVLFISFFLFIYPGAIYRRVWCYNLNFSYFSYISSSHISSSFSNPAFENSHRTVVDTAFRLLSIDRLISPNTLLSPCRRGPRGDSAVRPASLPHLADSQLLSANCIPPTSSIHSKDLTPPNWPPGTHRPSVRSTYHICTAVHRTGSPNS